MVELFTSLGFSEVGAYVVSLGSPIITILALVLVCILTLKKFTNAIGEFRNTDELKELSKQLRIAHADNEQLRKANKALLSNITKIVSLEDVVNEEE